MHLLMRTKPRREFLRVLNIRPLENQIKIYYLAKLFKWKIKIDKLINNDNRSEGNNKGEVRANKSLPNQMQRAKQGVDLYKANTSIASKSWMLIKLHQHCQFE